MSSEMFPIDFVVESYSEDRKLPIKEVRFDSISLKITLVLDDEDFIESLRQEAYDEGVEWGSR